MARSSTPILDLQTAPPGPKKSLSWTGLLRATPWAIAVVLLVFSIEAAFLFASHGIPAWLQQVTNPVSDAIDLSFRNGPLLAIVVIFIVQALTTLIHEAGHAIAAKLVGWPILEFRVMPISFVRQDGRWKARWSYKDFPPGLVRAEPVDCCQFHSKLRLFALGGPSANLVTAGLAVICENAIPRQSAFLILFILFSLLQGLTNLLPMHSRNFELDGYAAFRLTRNPDLLAARIAAIKMRKHLQSGRPLATMNRRWVALSTTKQKLSLQDKDGALVTYGYWVHRRKFDSAAMILERLLQISGDAHTDFRAFLCVQSSIFCSLRKQHTIAQVWRQRASEFPNLPDFQLLRCDAHLAAAADDIESAHRFALLTKQALLKKSDNRLRETYLKHLEPWIEELAASIQSRNTGMLNQATADTAE